MSCTTCSSVDVTLVLSPRLRVPLRGSLVDYVYVTCLCTPDYDVQIMGEPPMEGASTPVALPLDEVGAIRGGVSAVIQ